MAKKTKKVSLFKAGSSVGQNPSKGTVRQIIEGSYKTASKDPRELSLDMVEHIRSKAKELWEQRGQIEGKDLDIWLEAEQMVRSGK